MRFLLFLGVSLFFTLAFADHHEGDHKHNNDHHDHKDGHIKNGENQGKEHHQHHNKSMLGIKVAQYNSKFSFDLYRQVALEHPSENIICSPVSISIAFAVLSLGAKAQTHSQIIDGLNFNISEISEREIHEGFHHLLDLLNNAHSELQLSGGNALFISKEYKILQTFLEESKKLYYSEAFPTDFKNEGEAKNQINSYVEKSTHGKIAELLDCVDQDTIMVLINYIYFRGNWKKTFEEDWTEEGDFHVSENTTVKVPFMTRIGAYDVAFTDEATVISIPYERDANALFILPKTGKLPEIEQKFNKETIQKWKKLMNRRVVDLFLPRFNISSTINLKETLSKMGVVDVFSNNADLSGITGDANIKISKAIHKALLRVDEKGTEAAAATVVEVVPETTHSVVKFDQPFIFSLYDYKSKSILFMGRVLNPQK
ncbi:alpha-1-antitrypsin-like [Dendrobates tinctorius]|uniref:alpha-1-antitrypsin-like n=1 Tax=Dendrobates tinctorius TaxID=92724 RepID=UPI003CC92C02